MNKTVFNVLFGIAVLIFIGAWFYSGTIKPRYTTEQDAESQAILDRIRPVGQVVVEGAEAPARPAGDMTAPAEQPDAAASDTGGEPGQTADLPPVVAQTAAKPVSNLGQQTYVAACAVCHDAGIAGAPKLDDTEAWAPRIAQGANVLNEHAIKGFQGSAGMMPPKGGRLDLSDEAVIAAVAHMVEESKAP